MPPLTRKLFDLTTAGQLDQARAVQTRVTQLIDLIFRAGDFPEGVRAASVRESVVSWSPLPRPSGSLSAAHQSATFKPSEMLLSRPRW